MAKRSVSFDGESGGGMSIEFDLEGVDELSYDLSNAFSYLSQDLQTAVIRAGEDAVVAMQQDHPYTDRTQWLTGGMYCRPFGRATRTRAEAVVRFQAPYARYVNDGTNKSKPYPFIPVGMAAARDSLLDHCSYALSVFCKRAKE